MSTATSAPPRAVASAPRPPARPRLLRVRGAATAYLLLAPNLVLFGLFLLVPLVLTVVLSFQATSGFGVGEWIGFDNYGRMAGDDVFWRSALNTALFATVTVPLALAGGLGLALLLDRPIRGRTLFRSLFYLPYVLSGVVVALLGRWIFNENLGVVNKLLRALGGDGVAWQSSGGPAMGSIIAMVVWQSLGFCMVIYLAGLQGIPQELHEAAKVDGAGSWQRLWHVTLPQLAPTTLFLLVMGIIGSLQVFTQIYIMTKGGPVERTTTMVYFIYKAAFNFYEMGYATTLAFVLFAITLVFTAIQLRLYRRAEV